MTIRPIPTVPDFRLYTKSRPVGPIRMVGLIWINVIQCVNRFTNRKYACTNAREEYARVAHW